jgi:Tfp pilus assembly protein PilX
MHKNIQIALRLKNSQAGFALVAAIMASLILLALGLLVFSLSTQDIRVSAKIVGDKRALIAAEEGIHAIQQTFNINTVTIAAQVNQNRTDGTSNYSILYPAKFPTAPPECVPDPRGGSDIKKGSLKLKRYDLDVIGRNTAYNTQVRIKTEIGYGPVQCD